MTELTDNPQPEPCPCRCHLPGLEKARHKRACCPRAQVVLSPTGFDAAEIRRIMRRLHGTAAAEVSLLTAVPVEDLD